ncbi:MAG: kynureninase [Chloroflexi bacterium]|nr:kynureninase [Chloroflexota bacterium]
MGRFDDARAAARAQDAADELASFRGRFACRPGTVYLDGNSLGLISAEAEAAVLAALADWKQYGIDGWLGGERPWFTLGEELGARQARLVGALPHEVVVTGSTTVNLHALVATFYGASPQRTRIVANTLDFPSDLYTLASQIRLRGLDPAEHLTLVPSPDGRTIREDDLIAALDERTALLVIPSVLYRSGQLLDIARLTAAAHERGVLVGVDCSHSAGAVPHTLHDWGVDWAVWCSYKYLNGGPGAVAALYVHERHHGTAPGLVGWWGSDKARQFDMAQEFTPASHAGAWQIGTPPVLGAAALYGALGVVEEAGLSHIRAKSLALTGYLMELAREHLSDPPYGFTIGTPSESERRGGHVALEHPRAVQLCKALKVRGFVPDFRPPNVIRLAPIALYTSFDEVWQAVDALRQIVERGEHQQLAAAREPVA